MERLKNMSLKKAFFLLSLCGLLTSLCLLVIVWFVCQSQMDKYPSGGVAIQSDGTVIQLDEPTPEQEKILRTLSWIPLLSGVLFPVIGLGTAGVLFYRWKLKEPIMLLLDGTERIRCHDLDFSFPTVPADELGRVCSAFEEMRAELQKTNQELWRQSEERKRLNAAFAHDLRNPVTVLKGTVRLLKENRQDEQAIERLEIYTARLGKYIEAMSGIQKLEQMPVKTGEVLLSALCGELEETARLLCPHLHAAVSCLGTGSVMLDHGIFLTVAENLIGNAARFALEKIKIALTAKEDELTLTVADDGPGFPDKLIKNGPKPFEKGEEGGEHFGMGLYSSSLLCLKHGGNLYIENSTENRMKNSTKKSTGDGAQVTAVFQVRYPENI